jgi:hypothetical protein
LPGPGSFSPYLCFMLKGATRTVAAPPSPATAAQEEVASWYCTRVRDLFFSYLGGVTGYCVEASTILVVALRRAGLDAHLVKGAYARTDGPCFHAHVSFGGQIYDPTREQFEDKPLVSCSSDPSYQDDPDRPRRVVYPHIDDVDEMLMFESDDQLPLSLICAELGLGLGNPFPKTKMSCKEMNPEEMCYFVRDLFLEHVGGIDAMCTTASPILACLMRKHGYPAEALTGVYTATPNSVYGKSEGADHAYVRCGDKIYDSTREQFELRPLVSCSDSSCYRDEDWGEETFASCSTPDELRASFQGAFPWGENKWLVICSEIGL